MWHQTLSSYSQRVAHNGRGTVDKTSPEEDAGVGEHPLLQAHNQKLRIGKLRLDHLPDVLRVAQVKRSVNLVEDVNGSRTNLEHRQNERQREKRPLTPGKLGKRALPGAVETHPHLDAVDNVAPNRNELGLGVAEQDVENVGEVARDCPENVVDVLVLLDVELGDDAVDLVAVLLDLALLPQQVAVVALHLVVELLRPAVHPPSELVAQLLQLRQPLRHRLYADVGEVKGGTRPVEVRLLSREPRVIPHQPDHVHPLVRTPRHRPAHVEPVALECGRREGAGPVLLVGDLARNLAGAADERAARQVLGELVEPRVEPQHVRVPRDRRRVGSLGPHEPAAVLHVLLRGHPPHHRVVQRQHRDLFRVAREPVGLENRLRALLVAGNQVKELEPEEHVDRQRRLLLAFRVQLHKLKGLPVEGRPQVGGALLTQVSRHGAAGPRSVQVRFQHVCSFTAALPLFPELSQPALQVANSGRPTHTFQRNPRFLDPCLQCLHFPLRLLAIPLEVLQLTGHPSRYSLLLRDLPLAVADEVDQRRFLRLQPRELGLHVLQLVLA
ncbi:voltage-dependent L-type calcium channel subunit alpha-1S [Babesia caballi]|uniref:Voltage-dependent L-type calcium channel subunit alpha-1S n=1 Tax=Babesia caballi TaxID=5871 RepID=A0AAV4LZG0_BABCB|nr:voltage-dependent L-type calcium channel subunit alpha-1S [Babesia caballi]